ncbi:hypothetical protein Aduo_005114 [Ancylostoma duodenale]
MKTRNAFDFVLSADPAIFLDVDIISRRPQQKTTLDKETFSSALEQLPATTDLSNYGELKKAMKLAASVASTKQTKEKHKHRKARSSYSFLVSEATRKLYEERHRLLHQPSPRSTVELSLVNKALRDSLQRDIERKHLVRLHQAACKGNSIRKALQENKMCTRPLTQLKGNDGSIAGTPATVTVIVQDFYNNLLSSTRQSFRRMLQCPEEELPPVLAKVRNALEKLKIGKTLGSDHITVEMLFSGYHVLEKPFITMFNECFTKEHLPTSLADSMISLLFKKGEPMDI